MKLTQKVAQSKTDLNRQKIFDVDLIIVVIITWPREKPSEKKTLTSQLSGSLIGSNGLIYSKF